MADGVRKWRHEDEMPPYQRWHRERLTGACVATDVDQVEMRWNGSGLQAAAVIELTRAKAEKITPGHPYMQKIVDRYDGGAPQSWLACRVARALGVDAYVCVYDEALMANLSASGDDQPMAVRNLTRRKDWLYTDRLSYGLWLRRMGAEDG